MYDFCAARTGRIPALLWPNLAPPYANGTFTRDLHALADWLRECGVTSVAMGATGVSWIPAFEILEARGFDVILVNARYAKNVPGRKTGVSDAGWLRQLHSYGLLRGSFRPILLKNSWFSGSWITG